jgi:hypothetical protein
LNDWLKRLADAVSSVGGTGTAAEVAGVSRRAVHGYLAGKNDPPFSVVVGIAAASRRSLDWLAFGSAPSEPPPLDEELLVEIVTMIEIEAERRGERPAPDKYAALVVLIYNEEMRHAAAERRADAGTVRRAFRLVS